MPFHNELCGNKVNCSLTVLLKYCCDCLHRLQCFSSSNKSCTTPTCGKCAGGAWRFGCLLKPLLAERLHCIVLWSPSPQPWVMLTCFSDFLPNSIRWDTSSCCWSTCNWADCTSIGWVTVSLLAKMRLMCLYPYVQSNTIPTPSILGNTETVITPWQPLFALLRRYWP